MKKAECLLIDTTLRDGEQSPGFAFSAREKRRLATLLDRAGVPQIEAGVPAMGAYEKNAICGIMENRRNARISVWNRLRKSDLLHSFDCRPDIIHISAPVSASLIGSKLNRDAAWVREKLKECVSAAREKGYVVTVGFEDASRADVGFMLSLTKMLRDMGVAAVRYADTVGMLTPSRAAADIGALRAGGAPIGVHAHNDIGMAVANSLAAVKAGALYVDTTLFGIGERAGNCDMQVFLSAAGRICEARPAAEALPALLEEARAIIFRSLTKNDERRSG